jgi:Ca2+-binding RTX toxin-like protein
VFWTSVVPDGDVQVNPGTGAAEMHLHNLPELDYYSPSGQGDLASLGPTWQSGYFAATISVDVAWSSAVKPPVNVRDTANGFAGTFNENQATVTWSVHSDSGFSFTSNPGNFATSVPETPGVNGLTAPLNFFAEVGHEQNGVFLQSGAVLLPDPVDAHLSDLVVNGSPSGRNDIEIGSKQDGKVIEVQIDARKFDYQGEFQAAGIARLIVDGGPGDNRIAVSDDVGLPAFLFGGDGNDHIQAGGGPTVIVGGAGNDQLEGGAGRSILVGGTGSDRLESGSGDTILFAGSTAFDSNVPALVALLTEWSRADESYLQRVANLSNNTVNGVAPNGLGQNAGYFLTSATVHDDGAGNYLEGGPGMDWYFANLNGIGNNGVEDVLEGRKSAEVVTPTTT